MDVFGLDGEFDLSRFDVSEDLLQGLYDQVGFFLSKDALLAQHLRVGDAPGDIFTVHSLVKTDGCVEFIRR